MYAKERKNIPAKTTKTKWVEFIRKHKPNITFSLFSLQFIKFETRNIFFFFFIVERVLSAKCVIYGCPKIIF